MQSGKPTQNSFIERFNGIFRRGVLDANIFDSLDHAREIAADWVDDYNQYRPHNALVDLIPILYLTKQTEGLCKIKPTHFSLQNPSNPSGGYSEA